MLIAVAAFREPWEAHMFRSRLEAEGVPAFVAYEYHVGNAWHYSNALGGVKVHVDEERKDEARSIERRCRDGEYRSLLESEFGAMDEVHCPNCGSHDYWKRRPVLQAVAAVAFLGLFRVIVPPKGWVYFCNKCGTKFRQPLCPNTFGRLATIFTAIAYDVVFALVLTLCFTRYWRVVAVAAILIAGLLTTR